MKKLLGVLTISFLTTLSARASVLIDPYFGYMTSGSASFAPGASETGTEIGARLGWDFLGLGVGLDTILSGKYTYASSGVNVDVTPSLMGLFVSYKFPILVRGYATYFITAKEKNTAGDVYSGTATKIGVQFTGLPFIAIGLETYSGSYKDYTPAGGSSGSASETSTHTNFTISAPFNF